MFKFIALAETVEEYFQEISSGFFIRFEKKHAVFSCTRFKSQWIRTCGRSSGGTGTLTILIRYFRYKYFYIKFLLKIFQGFYSKKLSKS